MPTQFFSNCHLRTSVGFFSSGHQKVNRSSYMIQRKLCISKKNRKNAIFSILKYFRQKPRVDIDVIASFLGLNCEKLREFRFRVSLILEFERFQVQSAKIIMNLNVFIQKQFHFTTISCTHEKLPVFFPPSHPNGNGTSTQ